MGKLLQELIARADEGTLSRTMSLLDDGNVMDNDFNEIYHQIIECGTSAYGAAKIIFNSGKSTRSLKTLHYHAQQIEVNLLEFLGQITPKGILDELKLSGEVECPDELISEFERLLKDNSITATKSVRYALPPHKG